MSVFSQTFLPALAAELHHGQPHHCYLFCGAEATAQALLFAMGLNCTQATAGYPCGECPACRRILAGSYGDLLTVAPQKGWIRIEQIREMQAKAALAPLEGGYKVVLIQAADFLREEAANSLLKILEEPPTQTVFLLSAQNRDKILPTILSRSRIYHLSQEGSLVVDDALLAAAMPEARQFLTALPQAKMLYVLRFAQNYDKDKDGLLYLLIALWQLLAAQAKSEQENTAQREIALKAALFVERAIDLLRRNINQRLLSDVVFLRLWRMWQIAAA